MSNILAIAELFAFWGLNDVVKKAVKDGVTAATLKSDFVLAAGLITFITVFLMIFSMKYYMKLRIKDDPIIASSCDRIIFLKDGKVKEDLKRTGDKEQFYNEIITNWC